MPKVYAIDGITPVVHPSAFVHPSAVLIGDVIVRARASLGPCASLRGDFGRIVVEEGANIQDTCMLHAFPGRDTVVGAESTIGHGAVLHGCVVRRGALVGMNCVVNVRSARTMELVEALTEPEENRKSIAIPGAIPLSELKKKHA
jgi:phenylacetic acid degradation protein